MIKSPSFAGAYAAANSPPKSGYGPKDYLKLAHEIFLMDYKAKFMLEHAWELLQNEQKWCELSSTKGVDVGSSKRKKCDNGSIPSGSSQSVNNVKDEAEVRPVGVKAAKAKLKRSVSNKAIVEEQTKKLENLQTVWELKQKDVALKKELSHKNMLEILLARTEPLSELELALKNRLIEKFLLQTTCLCFQFVLFHLVSLLLNSFHFVFLNSFQFQFVLFHLISFVSSLCCFTLYEMNLV
ncbi:Glutathione S-transferase T3 [Cardamine amara subsp. amara]|uniref:Glutathione S-transferase T3 n=1 Tax=Cardamine amara subsp. amara TaxID=228776 RepID=A0ABD1B6S7_CARAN